MNMELIVIFFFIAVLLVLLFFYVLNAAVKRSAGYELRRRLGKLAVEGDKSISSDLAGEVMREMTPLDEFLYKFPFFVRMDRLIDQAGVKFDLKRFFIIILMAGVVGFFAGLLLRRGFLPPVILMLIGLYVPFLYLMVKKKEKEFDIYRTVSKCA